MFKVCDILHEVEIDLHWIFCDILYQLEINLHILWYYIAIFCELTLEATVNWPCSSWSLLALPGKESKCKKIRENKLKNVILMRIANKILLLLVYRGFAQCRHSLPRKPLGLSKSSRTSSRNLARTFSAEGTGQACSSSAATAAMVSRWKTSSIFISISLSLWKVNLRDYPCLSSIEFYNLAYFSWKDSTTDLEDYSCHNCLEFDFKIF